MGLFGRKKDFWDEVDAGTVKHPGEDYLSDEETDGFRPELEDGGPHPTKNLPLKVVARILLFVVTAAMAISGFLVYTYFNNGGTWSSEPNYYQSSYFGEEYNRNVVQLLHLVQAVEQRGEVSAADQDKANEELIQNYMSVNGNFSFAVYDEDDNEVITSSEDAVKRIEASHYFVKLDSSEGQFRLNTGVDHPSHDTGLWKDTLLSMQNGYTIYGAVDNELISMEDGFYANYIEFKQMVSRFNIARIVLIVTAILFLVLLVFCIIATGNVRGYVEVQLTWFDKIFTEIAAIISLGFGGGALYGAYVMYRSQYDFRMIAAGAFLVLAYIFLVRGYFSLVRRIKAGTFIKNMVFYRLFEQIGQLPTVPKVLLILLVLLLLNGALVLALFKLDTYEILGIPFVYILVPIIFVLENICFISWVIHRGGVEYSDEEIEEADEEDSDMESQTDVSEISAETAAADVSSEDWENMDLGAAVDEAILENNLSEDENLAKGEGQGQTVILPQDELESLLGVGTEIRDSATSFDFIQLNKDIRKLHRSLLKEKDIAVTLRSPDKPIVLEMNKEDMWKAISMIYDNLEQYAEEHSRIYAEMYTQGDKLIYIVKNAVKAEALEAAKEITSAGAELTGGLKTTKDIVEKNQGKFVVAMDGNIFKTGIMMSMTRD